jgi:predicted nucleic acid-binding protein
MSDPVVVSNSGPLISLSSVSRLDLLRQLFGKICIPEAVYREVVILGGNRPGQEEVRNAKWITVQKISDDAVFKIMLEKLDPGESESIALANEIKADYIILDERLARRKAKRLDLCVVGTLGILLMAKKSGYLENISMLLNELEKASFRISGKVKSKILEKAGESLISH